MHRNINNINHIPTQALFYNEYSLIIYNYASIIKEASYIWIVYLICKIPSMNNKLIIIVYNCAFVSFYLGFYADALLYVKP